MTPAPAISSPAQALQFLETAMGFLADADVTQLPTEVLAQCLRTMERVDTVEIAARTRVLGAFVAGRGYCEDGDYSLRSWLPHKTRITRAAASGHTAWVGRAEAHPRYLAAMAGEDMSGAYARTLSGWTDKFPEDCRDAADEILAAAARAGMDLRDLAALAAEMLARACPLTMMMTTRTGRSGTAPSGSRPRSRAPGCCRVTCPRSARRWSGPSWTPDRAGCRLGAAGRVTERVRAQWAGHRAAASVGGGDGAAWLDGDAAEGFACDATITPVVFGEVNDAVLDELVGLCVQLAGYRHGTAVSAPPPADSGAPSPDTSATWPAVEQVPAGLMSRESLERAIIGKTTYFLLPLR